MDRKRLIIDIALGVALLALAGLAWAQQRALADLEEQIARMEARVDAVDGQTPIARTGGRAADVVGTDARTPAAAIDAVAEAGATNPSVAPVVPRLGAKPGPEFDANDPAVRGQLREVIQEEQELVRVERQQERQQRREQRLRQQVNELADKTSMDAEIGEQLADLLVVEQVEAMEVFRQARENFGWDEAREKVSTLRVETDAKAKDLLEDEEYAEFEKMRAEEMERWNRGPRRGRDRTPNQDTRSAK